MRVYLCRHAKAAPGEPDELRPLTAEGERQAGRLAERLAAEAEPPAIVVSSPLLRARQTAEAIARATGADLRVDVRLSPGAGVADLRVLLAGVPAPVATVGHQPDCSEIALAVTGRDTRFPPGGVAALEVET